MEFTLRRWNEAYRKGEPIVSDEKYDGYLDKLKDYFPKNDFLKEIGYKPGRKEKLPVYMGSLNKVKTIEELKRWATKCGITDKTDLVVTPKYDGMALCVDEEVKLAWTRGDSTTGVNVSEHFGYFNNHLISIPAVSIGEVVISYSNFISVETPYKNPRSIVVGNMNSDEPNGELLGYMEYKCFGVPHYSGVEFARRREELNFANAHINKNPVPYHIINKVHSITLDELTDLYKKWSSEYPMDGLVIEVDSMVKKGGCAIGSSGNPIYTIAFKGDFEEVKEAVITSISWGVSKRGLLKPVAHIKPVKLDGADATNINLDNARYVKENGIGVNTVITVKRSGMVIPRIVSVVSESGCQLPRRCPECKEFISWNETKVDLVCKNEECDGSIHKKISSFFRIVGVEDVSHGIFEVLIDNGYDTIPKILEMTKTEFESLPGFKSRKAAKVFNAIHSVIETGVTLPVLQHASGLFYGLGSTKLTDIENHLRPLYDSHIPFNLESELLKVDGISDKSASIYIRGSETFFNDFILKVPSVKILTSEDILISNKLEGEIFVFTDFRDGEMEENLIKHGAKIGSGINKKTTYLITKEKGSGTSKEQKAIEYGVKIIDKGEAEKLIERLS